MLAIAIALGGGGRRAPSVPFGASPDDRHEERIIGTIAGAVSRTPRGFGARLQTDTSSILVWTTVRVEPGQRVAVVGRLRAPRELANPGAHDRARFVASRGAEWELSATSVELIANEPDWRARTWRWAMHAQQDLAAQIQNAGEDSEARAALEGIVTGNRAHISEQLDARWRAVGIYHVLSVSGLHLAVIAGLAYALLRRLAAASPLGRRSRPARWAAPIALVLAVGYTLITGAQLATLRALVIVAIVLVSHMLDRPVRLLDAIGAAAVVLLLWRPSDLYDPSFQLSFVATLTLALVPPRAALAVDVPRRARVWRWLRRGLTTSAWVAITTAPITALHFHQVAAGGVVGNLVLTPLVELAALPLGLAGAALGSVGAETVGAALVEAAVWIVARVDDCAALLSDAMPLGAIALDSPLVVAVLVATALWLCSRRERSRIHLVAWAVLCGVWIFAPAARSSGALRVTFLDVGQGDAALVELPGGEVWLVDAGGIASARQASTASAPGEAIARTLAVYGHDAIDLAIVSHPHPDHYLGLASLGAPIRELWFVADRHGSFGDIVEALVARGTRVGSPQLGEHRRPDGVTVWVWGPRHAPATGGNETLATDPVRSVNDNSLVVAIEYAGRTVLVTGDLEAEGEEALVAAGLAKVDVVKVAHHGSRTSSSVELVEATRPELAVISCGVGNAFDFPAAEVIARWRAVGATVARTDRDGAITVTIGMTGDLVVDRYRRDNR
jgi:competence protein ComEC